jgi:HlyD family secretion protein
VEEEISGMEIQRSAEEAKLAILREEIAGKAGLLEKGLAQRDEVNALRRAEADSAGRIGSLAATVAQRRATIAELRQEQITREATRRENAAREANEARTRIGDLREQLAAREEALTRTRILSPADGVVVRIAKNTIGGVVRPGETVIELLPSSRELVVDARVAPGDVDAVHVGQVARLRLTALNQRTTPEIGATVAYVSADRLIDTTTGEAYFTARLAMDRGLPDGVAAGQILPGMPVETYIGTGERTFVEYLVRPLADSFAKAFREE